jgi:hypothetical protein
VVAEQLAKERPVRGLIIDHEDERRLAHGSRASTSRTKVAKSIGLLR